MVFGKHFVKYYFKYFIFFALGIGILVLVDIAQLDIPRLLGEIIDYLQTYDKTGAGEISVVNGLVFEIIKVVAIVSLGRVFWRLLIFGTSRRIEHDLRTTMFDHSTRLAQDFYSYEKVGGMMTYFINDLSAIRMAFGPGVMTLIDTFALGGIAIFKMAKLDTVMTIIAVVPMGLMVVAMYLINKSMRKQFRKRQDKFRDLSDYTQENYSGITVIKAYVREIFAAMTFRLKSDELYDANIKYVRRSTWTNIITSITVNAVIISIIAYGSILAIKTDFSTGQLVEYYGYFMALLWPARALGRFLTISSQAQASARRVGAFLDAEVSVRDEKDVLDVTEITPSIKVKGLNFAYPDDGVKVLEDISFEIDAGQMVGILGKTGSGKTTLVDLLLRVYNVSENSIELGGYDIMKLPLKTVRNTVGYVPQDNFLFSDTISNNISFAYDDLSEEEIIKAAKLADIYTNIVDFKEGFDTILGERGVTVSGGQKQRISIARAIAKNPDILILDDSVSAVDTKTEETIIKNLYDLRKGKTTIFIAHRISTVRNMDKIILLDDGKIVDIGSHNELMEKSPMYRDMVKRQELADLASVGGDLDA